MKNIWSWILGLFMVLSFGGCQKKESQIDTVTINLGMDPPTLSCQAATKNQVLIVIRHLSEGLTRINSSGEIEPALAEKITVLDEGRRYHFVLRKNAQWAPGIPVKAQDFERSYLKMLTKAAIAPMVDQLFTIKNARPIYQGKMAPSALGLQVINDHEIQFELEEPNPVFLNQLSTPLFFPIPEDYQPDAASKVSCGAYYLKEWQREKQLVAEKNPDYWDAENIKLERIVFTTIADAHTQFEMFNAGQLDWCGSPFLDIPEEAVGDLIAKGKLHNLKEAKVEMLVFNTRKGIFSNAKVRRAFSYAIDRPMLVKQRIYTGSPAASFVPPTIMGQDTPYFPYYAPEEAKALLKEGLEEMGLTMDALPKIKFLYFNKSPFPRRAQAIQAGWNKVLSVQADLIGLEWQMLVQTLLAGDFDVATASWAADFPDPINFLQLYRDLNGGRNYPAWEDGRYQHQLEMALHSSSLTVRKNHLQQAERLLMDQMIIAPLSFPQSPYLCSDRLKNVFCNPLGYVDLRWAYVE